MNPRCFVLSLVLLAVPSIAGAQSPDDTAIRKQIASYAEARRGGDGKAQARFYTPDAGAWLSSNRKMVRGRDEIAHVQLPPNPERRFVLVPRSVKLIKPDVALVDAEYGPAPQAPNGQAFYVFVKSAATG